jgi:amidohydrolase
MKTLFLLLASTAFASAPSDWAKQNLKTLVPLYHALHQAPELSNQETNTAARLAQEFKAAGYEVTTGVGGTGVVAVLKNGAGKTAMLRTDLDALPVTENTGLSYASKVQVKNKAGSEVGVMHACGHDVHMTNMVGTARYLAEHKADWKGTVVLIAQPAEELGEGAAAMMKDGLFKRFPRPDYALALHVSGDLEAGKIGYHAGYAMAADDSMDITMKGRGGHGASPHLTVDPIYLSSLFVVDLQSLISRERNPLEPAVITVGAMHCGTKANIISDACELQVTVRTFDPDVRARILKGIERKAKAIAQSAGAPEPTIRLSDVFVPAVYNEPALVDKILPSLRKALGDKNVVEKPAVMGAEDFGRFSEAKIPVFMWTLGTIETKRLKKMNEGGKNAPSLHSALYYPDIGPSLEAGIASLSSATIELLKP